MVEIEVTDEFEGWYAILDDDEADSVNAVVAKLEVNGLQPGSPHSSCIEGSSFGLRELRPKRGNSPLGVFYAFDPRRNAILILAGDKSNDKKFYARMVKACEQIWAELLEEMQREGGV